MPVNICKHIHPQKTETISKGIFVHFPFPFDFVKGYSFFFGRKKHIPPQGRCRACESSTNRSLKLKRPWSTTRGDGLLHPPRVRFGGLGWIPWDRGIWLCHLACVFKVSFFTFYLGKSLLNHHLGNSFKFLLTAFSKSKIIYW